MKILQVKNWLHFQHYKKRSPPWIKLHREILNDYAFMSLKDRAKGHLLMIWVLAAGNEGEVPHDAKFLASRIGATEPVDIDALIAAGFLVPAENDAIAQPEHRIRGNGEDKPADETPIIERIPIIGGEEWPVHQSLADELTRLYPSVDVPQTLREIRGWCLGNATKLKTARGVRRFLTSWIAREQDKHG